MNRNRNRNRTVIPINSQFSIIFYLYLSIYLRDDLQSALLGFLFPQIANFSREDFVDWYKQEYSINPTKKTKNTPTNTDNQNDKNSNSNNNNNSNDNDKNKDKEKDNQLASEQSSTNAQ